MLYQIIYDMICSFLVSPLVLGSPGRSNGVIEPTPFNYPNLSNNFRWTLKELFSVAETYRWKALPLPDAETPQYFETPYQRYGHTVVVYKGKAYLWGGRNDSAGASSVLHEFDPGKLQSVIMVSLDMAKVCRETSSMLEGKLRISLTAQAGP